MKKYFIPIIGTISSGKTTFLNGFLDINLLQTGSTTTTKFICLIKNSANFKFYHVLPKKEDKIINFIKEGEETAGEEKIKERIEEINKHLSENNKSSTNDLFYILELPIKNIDNQLILDNCYFMDIPGLNEGEKTYIEDIFSLINIEDILFEIIIFDSTNIGSDNILKILHSLKDKNALKNENNLFILNKIDLCSRDGEENILDTFKNYFYKTFDEGQNNENSKININIYNNHFIPMNSISYLSETKLRYDFNSLLVFELYNYLENYKFKYSTYFEYIKKKIEFYIDNEGIDIKKENKKIEEDINSIIKGCVENLKIINKLNPDVNFGINNKCEKELKNMYILFKLQKYTIEHTDSYKQLQKIINNLSFNNDYNANISTEKGISTSKEQKKLDYTIKMEDNEEEVKLSFINKNNKLLINIHCDNIPQKYSKEFSVEDLVKLHQFFQKFVDIDKVIEILEEAFKIKNPKIKKIDGNLQLTIIPVDISDEINIIIPKIMLDNIIVIEQLDNFFNRIFDEIDPEKELTNFRISLQTLRENILGRKLRISLIGNISVGKSTVLNCIIGEKLLPTKDSECTYRGVILRYKNEDEFKLYKTKLISRGLGKDEYYFFEEQKTPHCKGIKDIKDYLKNKNSDKNITDGDAYFIITGKLKIFDFLNLDQKIIKIIEFIDLPGNNRKDNNFNKKEYYKKILKFSNCCIYINEPKSIEDGSSIEKMITQYSDDKLKIFPNLRMQFIKTCIFLVNKSDYLINDKNEKNKITKILIDNIKKMEQSVRDNELNISFFSGKFFEYFLDQKNFIDSLEKNPHQLFSYLINDWHKQLDFINFKEYILNMFISNIEDKLDLDSEDDEEQELEIEIAEDIKNKLKDAFNKEFKSLKGKIDNNIQDLIIQKLYILYDKIKKKNFDESIYSKSFFDKIKEVIFFSDELQNNNLKLSMLDFMSNADLLFKKKLNRENKEELERLSILEDKLKSIFNEEKIKIKDIIEKGRELCINLVDEEIKNSNENLKNVGNDIEKAKKNLIEKIKNIVESNGKEIEKEKNILFNKLMNITKEFDNNVVNKNIRSMSNDINVETKTLMLGKVSMGVLSSVGAISGIYTGIGIEALGFVGYSLAGFFFMTAAVPITAVIFYNYFKKSDRYKESLKSLKMNVHDSFGTFISSFEDDFKCNENTIINDLKIKQEILKKNLKLINEDKWEEKNSEYSNLKSNIQNAIYH